MNKIILGECLEVMKRIKADSVDTIITDPPYGLSFMGKKWDYDVPKKELWKECLRVLKPGGTALIFAGTRTQHRMAVNVEDAGFELRDVIMWLYGSGFPKATDIALQLDKNSGVQKHRGSAFRTAGAGDRKDIQGKNGISGMGNREPITSEAKLWNGWKSHGLKPAYEPILVAMKPNDGTYANNALKHGVSGLNIDGGRIGYQSEKDITKTPNQVTGYVQGVYTSDRKRGEGFVPGPMKPEGRFPANIILDEEAGKMLDEQSGESKSVAGVRGGVEGGFMTNNKRKGNYTGHTDKGGASRFFYCAKASKSERNMGCDGLEKKQYPKEHFSSERLNDLRMVNIQKRNPNTNNHPTVKPLSLMRYLCRLTKTPTGGTVLDPFAGSGTTLLAAKMEGRDYIGIEKEREYVEIAKARLNTFIQGKLL